MRTTSPQFFAEWYAWINPEWLAHRIARFPAAGELAVKDRIHAITLAPAEDFRCDSDLPGEGGRAPRGQKQVQAVMERGFQTRDAENGFGKNVGRTIRSSIQHLIGSSTKAKYSRYPSTPSIGLEWATGSSLSRTPFSLLEA